MTKPLTREAFDAALRAGRGRAPLHIAQFGLADVADLVLGACLEDQAYDPQVELSRAEWLLDMFHGSTAYESFSSSILTALEQEMDTWNLQQLCELAALMAKRGDKKAHEALRRRALREAETGDDIWVGAEELLSVDWAAAAELARLYGRRLQNEPDGDLPLLNELTEEPDILAKFENILQESATSDTEIRAYLTYWHQAKKAHQEASWSKYSQEERLNLTRERIRRELPLEKIFRDASAEEGEFPGHYAQFGRYATQEELAIVLQRLERETSEGVCQRLLWVFRRANLPQVSPKIWQLASSKKREIRSAALEALAQLQDKRVGELGRSRLLSGEFTESDSETLDLFIRNYLPGDEELIMTGLRGLVPTPENAHSLCWSLLAITEKNASPCFLPVLDWVYEMTPCANCRFRSLRLLHNLGGMSQDIIRECLFDAEEDIRHFAEAVQGGKNV